MLKDVFPLHRPQWKTHIGFLLAAIGSAVGLGNIWRFPYLCYKNGGGAFLIPYLVGLMIIGIPLLILEIGLGHKMRGSAPASFAVINKKWEWVGWWQVILVMFGIVLYYSVVISWCFNYLFFAFNGSWTENPERFFFKQFLMISDAPFHLGDLRTPIVFSLMSVWGICWMIVFGGVQKGLERANKIFMPLLFGLMAVIVIWSLRLPGAQQGINLYLSPQFERLKDIRVWIDAFSQIFFSLSLGFGIMIAYASYLPKNSQIVRDSVIICLGDAFFSIFSGFGVFAILGYMAQNTGQQVSEVVRESIGLAFIAYPKAISMLPHFSQVFGVIFFAVLIFAGLSSAISIIEAFTSAIIDKYHYPRQGVVSVLCVFGFLGSLIFTTQAGLFWIDILDHFLTNYGLVLAGVLECVVLGWVFRPKQLREHVNHFSDWKLHKWWWDISVKFIAPLLLTGILIFSLKQELAVAYGGYPWLALILIGRDWLVCVLFFAVIVASHPWKEEPHKRVLTH